MCHSFLPDTTGETTLLARDLSHKMPAKHLWDVCNKWLGVLPRFKSLSSGADTAFSLTHSRCFTIGEHFRHQFVCSPPSVSSERLWSTRCRCPLYQLEQVEHVSLTSNEFVFPSCSSAWSDIFQSSEFHFSEHSSLKLAMSSYRAGLFTLLHFL